ncbi:MAG: M23 family metallopeptidase [Cetobacterium sp.]
MLREEKFVYLNGMKVSNNGFKNLSFEMSRFSDSFSTIRGFGSHLNDKNLSVVDTFSIEFYIDHKELKEFAIAYNLFKTFGALPLSNQYILEKVSSSLSHQKMVKELLEDHKDKVQAREISHLIVFLERIDITSLERTNNGYSVNLVLTMLKHGFTSTQYETYMKKYEHWLDETKFMETIEPAINEQIVELGSNGSVKLEIFSMEELNAKYKNRALMNYKKKYIENEDSVKGYEEELEERYSNLNDYQVITPQIIEIPSVNIGQIQIIANNSIANIPIYGEAIGDKSFLGLDRTALTVKMIFDESDKVLLNKLKELSDMNITNHKIRVTTALANLFDFHSAIVTNVFFNNVEEANGVMVTIKLELSSYDYFSENENIDTVVDLVGKSKSLNSLFMTNLFLESVCKRIFKSKNIFNVINQATLSKLFDTPLETQTYDTRDNFAGGVGTNTTDFNSKTQISSYRLGDFLGSYSSDINSFGRHQNLYEGSASQSSIEKNGKTIFHQIYFDTMKRKMNNINPYEHFNLLSTGIDVKNTWFDGDVSTSLFTRVEHDLYGSLLYRYVDLVSCSMVYQSEKTKENISMVYSGQTPPGFGGQNEDYGVLNTNNPNNPFVKDVVEDTVNYFFNEKRLLIDEREVSFLKTVYRQYFFDHFRNSMKSTVISEIIKSKTITTTSGINFVEIRNLIEKGIIKQVNDFNTMLNNERFINDTISVVLSEVSKGQKGKGYTNDNIKYYLESFIDSFRAQVQYKSKQVSELTDYAYGIFISKLTYSLTNLYLQKGVSITDKEIKTNIISAITMGFLNLRVRERTDSFGYAIYSAPNIIGKRLSGGFYTFKKTLLETKDSITFEMEDHQILKKYFEMSDNESYYLDKIMLNYFDIEKIEVNTANKDYNYFYGKRIENEGVKDFLNDVFRDTSDLNMFENNINDYLDEEKFAFEKGKKYSDEISELVYEYPSQQIFFPASFHKELFVKDGKINSVMKKRILGICNPFGDLDKINSIVARPTNEIIPDYEVVIKKTDLEFEGRAGARDSEKVVSVFLLKNIASIKIGYDPKTKIKTAKILTLDVYKKIFRADKSNGISVQIDQDGEISIFTIEPGDLMEIRLSGGIKKKVVFKGFIADIFDSGNVIEINGANLASSMYSNMRKKILMHDPNLISKTWNLASSYMKRFIPSSDTIDSKTLNQYVSQKSCNNHLFNAFTPNYNEIGAEYEKASFYNAAYVCLSYLPRSVKELFSETSYGTGALTMAKLINQQLNKQFGITDEIEDPRNTTGDPGFFRNIFNVDKDYDTYGLPRGVKHIDEVEVKYEENKTPDNITIESSDNVYDPITSGDEFTWPTKSRRVTSPFTLRRFHPVDKKYKQHRGIDIGWFRTPGFSDFVAKDNYIYAIKDGVCSIGSSEGSGKYVTIDHVLEKDGKKIQCSSFYCHLGSQNVKSGQSVKQGDIIGVMGSTGKVTGIHLHFEIKINGEKVDPLNYINGGAK